MLVLVYTSLEVIRQSSVKSARGTGHDIDVVVLHPKAPRIPPFDRHDIFADSYLAEHYVLC